MLVAGSAHALTIKDATLSSGIVTVSGKKAAKSAIITWETLVVTQATKGGAFTFTTASVPADCVGTLSDGVATIDVPIAGCTPSPTVPLLATGQTSCWDSSGNVITCAGTGQDGDIQAGVVLSYTSNTDGTITDNNTKLVWEKKTNCPEPTGPINNPDPHCYWNTYTLQEAFDYVAALNTANFAGHNDWRLPNVRELLSIVHYEEFSSGSFLANPFVALSPEFRDCANDSCSFDAYWSSTTTRTGRDAAWLVNFAAFNIEAQPKSSPSWVRAVRAACDGVIRSSCSIFVRAARGRVRAVC